MNIEPTLADDERFGCFNFQPEERIAELVGFLRAPEPARVVVLTGREGSGRGYLLQAALHRLRAAGQTWQLVDLDLEGYEPDHGSVDSFIAHLLLRVANSDERARLAQAFTPLHASVGQTLIGAAFVAALLGLHKPATEILQLLEKTSQPPPSPDGVTLLFDRLFDLLTDKAGVAVLIRHPHRLPDTLKCYLLEQSKKHPTIFLIFTAAPAVQDLVPVQVPAPLRIELGPLKPTDMPALLARCFSPSRLPPELGDTLWQVSKGSSRDMAARMAALIEIGCLRRDGQGVWQLPESGLEAAPLMRIFSYPFFDPLDNLIRSMPSSRKRQAIERFLAAAAICGDNIPADIVGAALGFDEDTRNDVFDFIDDHLVLDESSSSDRDEDDVHIPMFHDLQYNHPGLPHTAVYAFTHPIYRHAIRDRLSIAGWQPLAETLLKAFAHILPPFTRTAAEVNLSAVTFVEDSEARADHLRSLAWWVGPDEAKALMELLADQLARRALDPDQLRLAIGKLKSHWPPYRTMALLQAYRSQSGGVPVSRLAEYHFACGEACGGLGQFRLAVKHGLRASRILQKRDDEMAFASALHLAAFHLRSIGKARLGERFIRVVLKIVEAKVGQNHAIVAAVVNNLGLMLHSQGDHAGAKAALERALRIRQQTLGPDHPETQLTRRNLEAIEAA